VSSSRLPVGCRFPACVRILICGKSLAGGVDAVTEVPNDRHSGTRGAQSPIAVLNGYLPAAAAQSLDINSTKAILNRIEPDCLARLKLQQRAELMVFSRRVACAYYPADAECDGVTSVFDHRPGRACQE
jgi:hypothetical protein